MGRPSPTRAFRGERRVTVMVRERRTPYLEASGATAPIFRESINPTTVLGCPSAATLTIAVSALALLVSFVAATVGHGVLRPLLEARGITPWRLRDSVGSLPLVLIGGAVVGAPAALLTAWGITECRVAGWAIATAIACMGAGLLTMRLGLLALKKLT